MGVLTCAGSAATQPANWHEETCPIKFNIIGVGPELGKRDFQNRTDGAMAARRYTDSPNQRITDLAIRRFNGF
jgi:hypothetical protein